MTCMRPSPGAFDFYMTARCHDLHLTNFTCMFLGQYTPAIAAAEKRRTLLPVEIMEVRDRPKLAMMKDAYYSMKMHVLVRFWSMAGHHRRTGARGCQRLRGDHPHASLHAPSCTPHSRAKVRSINQLRANN